MAQHSMSDTEVTLHLLTFSSYGANLAGQIKQGPQPERPKTPPTGDDCEYISAAGLLTTDILRKFSVDMAYPAVVKKTDESRSGMDAFSMSVLGSKGLSRLGGQPRELYPNGVG